MNNRLLLSLLCTIGVLGCLVGGGVFYLGTHRLIDLSALENYNPGRPSVVLDDQGNELFRFQFERRELIPYARIPKRVIHAFISAEDQQFFTHFGISPRGIVRSALVNIAHGRKVQGASTITQQLAKLMFFTSERSFRRKIKEQLLALFLEWRFTKEQILEAYLNHVYFGDGVYGIQAAAQRYWGVSVDQLTVAQSATLAAILPSPERLYNLLSRPENVFKRRNVVLKLMFDQGYLDRRSYELAVREPYEVISERDKKGAVHVRELVRQMCERMVGHDALFTGGYVIQTTINATAQRNAERLFDAHVSMLRKSVEPKLDGGLLCIENVTGGIKALVGGYDPASKFNRAVQARVQMGSMFKPVLYATFVEGGGRFDETRIDEPLSINGWEPKNVTEEFEGTMTLANALMTSNNIVAVKLFIEQGPEKVISGAKRVHLPGPFPPYPSLALGCTECAPIHAAAMINVFANQGIYVEPQLVLWVKDRWGNKIWRARPVQERAFSWQVSSQVARGLQLATDNLKHKLPAWELKGQSLGKTGTTNEQRVCWFAGATPTHSTAIYLACDDNRSLEGRLFSAFHVTPLWVKFNATIENPRTVFVFDPTLERKVINRRSGSTFFAGSDAVEVLVPASNPIVHELMTDTIPSEQPQAAEQKPTETPATQAVL